MNSNFRKVNTLRGYVHNKSFGPYYIPVTQQNQLMKLYCDQNKKYYSLPQAEPIFSEKYPRLKSLIKDLKNDEGLIMSSYYMLPIDNKIRKEIFSLILNKKSEIHFVFERFIIKKFIDINKLENIIRLSKFTSQSNLIFKDLK